MKTKRHAKILELIRRESIETQEDLSQKLREEGFHVTQATISRDIRELKLTKVVTNDGRQKYVLVDGPFENINKKMVMVFKEGLINIDMAQNILVLHTITGMAMAVAAALDSMECTEILGTIAGDDTIMAVVRTEEETLLLMDKLKRIAEE